MAGDAILGIVKSFSGARWVPARSSFSASEIDRYAAALVETVDDLPLPIARIMAGRGLTADNIAAYLEPRLRELLPDPSRFQISTRQRRGWLIVLKRAHLSEFLAIMTLMARAMRHCCCWLCASLV